MVAPWLGEKDLEFVKDGKSVILAVWVASGALETLQKGGGAKPPTFLKGLRVPGAAQTPKMSDLQSLVFLIFKTKPECSHVKGIGFECVWPGPGGPQSGTRKTVLRRMMPRPKAIEFGGFPEAGSRFSVQHYFTGNR